MFGGIEDIVLLQLAQYISGYTQPPITKTTINRNPFICLFLYYSHFHTHNDYEVESHFSFSYPLSDYRI